VSTNLAKIAAMLQWQVPTTFIKLRGFLGLIGYYRKFVEHYGTIARPLTNLLHHKTFSWSDSAQEDFDKLKYAMSSTPVLAFLDFFQEFVVETDACDTSVGVVLSQSGHPIQYFSKGLSAANKKLSTYEKEFLAIMIAVEKWRCYLCRNPFVSRIDHQSLTHL
jgi:hypothetical protein